MKRIYKSPIGNLLIFVTALGLERICFDDEKECSEEYDYSEAVNKTYDDTVKWLDIYFSKKSPDFFPAINLKGTDFQKAVWTLLLDIPFGETVTYKYLAEKIASQLGKSRMSAQAIGGAVGKNPVAIIVPCHRVIGSDGSLTGYAGGLDKKEKLLAIEGVFI